MSLVSLVTNYKFHKGDVQRDAGLETPKNVERFDDLSYGPDGKWNLLDVYRPRERKGPLPVIVIVHGGAWVYGTKEVYQFYGMSLAQRGFAVVNFNYRLAPKAKFPAQLEDTNRVIAWMQAHAGEYGLDMDHVFMVGDSAGGHLLALYCCICTNPAYAAGYPFQAPGSFVPRAVALNCGIYDVMRRMKDDPSRSQRSLMRDLLGRGHTAQNLKEISPNRYITPDFPPVFVMTSTGDFLNRQPKYLLGKLKEHKVPYKYKKYGTEENLLPHVFHCNMKSEDAKICNDEQCAFFRRFL